MSELDISRKTATGVGDRIRSLRLRLDRSEQSFAALLGVPPETVRQWEQGQNLDRESLILIAAATDTAMEWLIAGLTPVEVGRIRKAASSSRLRLAGETSRKPDRIRPQSIFTDGAPPPSIAADWDVRSQSPPRAGRSRRRRPSAILLDLPGATLLVGSRAAAYRVTAGDPSNPKAGIQLKLVLRGSHLFEGGGSACEIGPGAGIAASSADGGVARYAPDGLYVNVFLPTASVLEKAPRLGSRLLQPIAADAPSLRLLGAYVSALTQSGDGLDPQVAPCVAAHFVDLAALLLGAEGDDKALAEAGGLKAARRSAAAEAIEAGAATPGFSALAVAGRLGVSEREVHDLFLETDDWFWDRVNARRIDVVKARLVDPKFARMTIAEIAFACGFSDLDEFDRLFAARFGDSASAFRDRR